MEKGTEEKQIKNSPEFGALLDKSIVVLRESVKRLISECGGVSLSTDCFAKSVDVSGNAKGMKDIEAVMDRLKFSLKQIFADENIPFKVTELGKDIKISQSDEYSKLVDYQAVGRSVDNKGRMSIGGLRFLKEGFPVNVYTKKYKGKFFVVISNRADFDLFKNGYAQKSTQPDNHKRIMLSDGVGSQIGDESCEAKVIARGSYAIFVSSGTNSVFASLESYEKHVLPLLEAQK